MIRSALLRLCFVALLFLEGCLLPVNSPEHARAAVIATFGKDARISGPMTVEQLTQRARLQATDVERIRILADNATWFFLLLVPDTKVPTYADDGSLVELIKPGNVVAVRHGRVVAEFAPVE